MSIPHPFSLIIFPSLLLVLFVPNISQVLPFPPGCVHHGNFYYLDEEWEDDDKMFRYKCVVNISASAYHDGCPPLDVVVIGCVVTSGTHWVSVNGTEIGILKRPYEYKCEIDSDGTIRLTQIRKRISQCANGMEYGQSTTSVSFLEHRCDIYGISKHSGCVSTENGTIPFNWPIMFNDMVHDCKKANSSFHYTVTPRNISRHVLLLDIKNTCNYMGDIHYEGATWVEGELQFECLRDENDTLIYRVIGCVQEDVVIPLGGEHNYGDWNRLCLIDENNSISIVKERRPSSICKRAKETYAQGEEWVANGIRYVCGQYGLVRALGCSIQNRGITLSFNQAYDVGDQVFYCQFKRQDYSLVHRQ